MDKGLVDRSHRTIRPQRVDAMAAVDTVKGSSCHEKVRSRRGSPLEASERALGGLAQEQRGNDPQRGPYPDLRDIKVAR